MSTVVKKKIEGVSVLNNGDDIVAGVSIRWIVYDESDPEYCKQERSEVFLLETENVNKDSEDFIKFENLTEEKIFDWLSIRLESKRIKEMEEEMSREVYRQAHPPEPEVPSIIEKELPWS